MMTKALPAALALVLTVAVGGCAERVDVEAVPVGSAVEVTRQDGGVVRGTLVARDAKTVKVKTGTASRTVALDQIADVRLMDAAVPAPLPALAKFREFTVPDGTVLAVRLDSALGSASSRIEDRVDATLTEAVIVDGTEVFPVNSVVRGEVAAVEAAGNVKGRARLGLRFTSVSVPGGGERYPIASRVDLLAPATKAKDAATIGIPAAGGAIVGGLIGGKKGAAIGTAVGGGAGAAVVLTTPGKEIRLPAGAPLALRLDGEVEVRLPINRS